MTIHGQEVSLSVILRRGWVIEEVNERAGKFLKKDIEDLKGAPVTLFWDKRGGEWRAFTLTLDKPTYSGEATFIAGDNRQARVIISGALLPGPPGNSDIY